MKKIIFGAAMALVLSLSACSNSDHAAANGFKVSAGQSDTITSYFGTNVGTALYNQFEMMHQRDSTISKADIMKGIQYALSLDDPQSFLIGMNIGTGIQRQIASMEEMGIKVDRAKFTGLVNKYFFADSLDKAIAAQSRMDFENTMNRIAMEYKAYDDSIKANSPEVLANIKAGEDFLAAAKKNDPEIKTTESGLSYKIENPGEGDKVAISKPVKLFYKGAKVDGTVFDQTNPAEPRTMVPSQLIPGMREGLTMLGKGGKATFYIPGKLGYGIDGQSLAGIGPNEMLVFEVEVVEIPDANIPRPSAQK